MSDIKPTRSVSGFDANFASNLTRRTKMLAKVAVLPSTVLVRGLQIGD
jgi:hypothetical protein